MTTDRKPPSRSLSGRQYDDATRRALAADRVEPRAARVSYDRDRRLMIVELVNGFGVCFSPDRVPGLAGATPAQLEDVRISPSGDGLLWGELDAHASLTGLVIEGLGLGRWAPKLMGKRRSEAKARAARQNGRRGGRPRRKTT